ncbi:hypothetical protein [Uliginosibacterium sp. 31-12]|uniref:hypothetical protein n=1 Tax=Uliginosibacterium sp. 31-12 TaxID=3062781 RepID=UPI0026E1D05F|nr:hypothetical protein [Uliginosibacterium sp. 31-12]MDO6387048.1 hypothetical protein [Uliginosibacterium sp. 31-12]
MRVIDYEPQFWYLLTENEQLILNVSCEHSFVGYDFTLLLSEEETKKFKEGGKPYINSLAEAINYSAPIARGSSSEYKNRNSQSKYEEFILDAIEQWQKKT